MNEFYDAIMQMHGAEEFKNLIKKWDRLSSNISKIPADLPILLPDVILEASSGSGMTYLLQKLADYLSERENLISFYGDYKFFEFVLGYSSEGEPFGEIDRFNECVSLAAGFRNEFRGIIRIDIDEYMGRQDEKYFRSFLEHLASNSEKWLIILTYAGGNEKDIKAMDVTIRSYMRVEKIRLEMPSSEEFTEYLEEVFGKYGLCVTEDGKELLEETVEKLRENKSFDGFKTVRLLGIGIVYELLSGDGDFSECLTADKLRPFSAESEYIGNFILNLAKPHQIGFSGGTK